MNTTHLTGGKHFSLGLRVVTGISGLQRVKRLTNRVSEFSRASYSTVLVDMLLSLKWSSECMTRFYFRPQLTISPAPERRKVDQVLPILPNEIYISIFEHISPPSSRLTPEELRIFTNLCGACRFFVTFCLPRV